MPRRKSGIDDAYAAFAHDRDRGLLYSEVIVAEAIICEKVLGLSRDDGLRLLRSAKTLEDLGPLALTASCKKAFLDHIDKVVWPALDDYFGKENALSSVTRGYDGWADAARDVEYAADIEAARQRVEKHRQRVLLAACQATDELHHLADFAKKDALAAQLFAQFKDVHSAIEAKCNPAEDLNLLRDVADPNGPSATVLASTGVAPISIGFGQTGCNHLEWKEFGIIITNRNGEMRALSSVLRNVLDAWVSVAEMAQARKLDLAEYEERAGTWSDAEADGEPAQKPAEPA